MSSGIYGINRMMIPIYRRFKLEVRYMNVSLLRDQHRAERSKTLVRRHEHHWRMWRSENDRGALGKAG